MELTICTSNVPTWRETCGHSKRFSRRNSTSHAKEMVPKEVSESGAGEVYCSMAMLALAVKYHYLPIINCQKIKTLHKSKSSNFSSINLCSFTSRNNSKNINPHSIRQPFCKSTEPNINRLQPNASMYFHIR